MPLKIMYTQFRDHEAAAKEVAALIRQELTWDSPHPHGLMLSGGGTPLALYRALAQEEGHAHESVRVLYTDERHLPYCAEESNHGAALPMLRAWNVPVNQMFPVDPTLVLDEAAERYNRDLSAFLENGGKVSTGFLGLGLDGHTCSLFPGAGLEALRGKFAAPVRRENSPARVTVTPDFLERAKRLIFWTAGPEKRHIVEQLLEVPESTTAGQAVARCKRVELWHSLH